MVRKKVKIAFNSEGDNKHLVVYNSQLRKNASKIYNAIVEPVENGCYVRINSNDGQEYYYYMIEFFECWDILTRRVLIEKIGHYL